MARIALIGASGNIGGRILAEALKRGHAVTGIVRNVHKLTPQSQLSITRGDIADPGALAAVLRGADVVVASVRWTDNASQLLAAVHQAGVARLIAIVGAGSLEVSPGVRVLDTQEFPAAWRPGAEGAARALDTLRTETTIDWVAVSPSWNIAPGQRTGKFRVGGDQLLRDAAGESRISREDFAVAIVDEIERPKHHRQRITVGY
ncbi:MAG: NAD(P)-dependent oxidoreductase [Steroidobacteraceae bacterium]